MPNVEKFCDGFPIEVHGPVMLWRLTRSSAAFGFQPEVCELQMSLYHDEVSCE